LSNKRAAGGVGGRTLRKSTYRGGIEKKSGMKYRLVEEDWIQEEDGGVWWGNVNI